MHLYTAKIAVISRALLRDEAVTCACFLFLVLLSSASPLPGDEQHAPMPSGSIIHSGPDLATLKF